MKIKKINKKKHKNTKDSPSLQTFAYNEGYTRHKYLKTYL